MPGFFFKSASLLIRFVAHPVSNRHRQSNAHWAALSNLKMSHSIQQSLNCAKCWWTVAIIFRAISVAEYAVSRQRLLTCLHPGRPGSRSRVGWSPPTRVPSDPASSDIKSCFDWGRDHQTVRAVRALLCRADAADSFVQLMFCTIAQTNILVVARADTTSAASVTRSLHHSVAPSVCWCSAYLSLFFFFFFSSRSVSLSISLSVRSRTGLAIWIPRSCDCFVKIRRGPRLSFFIIKYRSNNLAAHRTHGGPGCSHSRAVPHNPNFHIHTVHVRANWVGALWSIRTVLNM